MDQVVDLLDTLVSDLESLDTRPLSGDSAQAQENRAIRGAAAALARQRTREARTMLTRARERTVELGETVRAAHETAERRIAARPGSELSRVLDKAARTLVDRRADDVDHTVDLIVQGAMTSIPRIQHAGVSLVRRGAPVDSRSPSDEVVRDLDRLQAELGEGPCMDAIWTEERVLVPDMELATERWPRFAPAALDRGVRSLVAFQLFAASGSAGALNLYADAVGVFDETALDTGSLFASQAAIALHGAQRADGLSRALQTRDLIGRAKGILIERFSLSDDGAFALLVTSSQDSNLKLADVARWLVDETTAGRE